MAGIKKTTPKKVAKKTAVKKAVAKTAPKKVSKPKSKPVKKVAKPKAAKPAKKKTTPESKNIKFLPKLPTSISLRNRLSLMALSPYRFPALPQLDKFAVGTARVAGLAFILIGAFFTYQNTLPLSTELARQAVSGDRLASVADSQSYSNVAETDSESENRTLSPLVASEVKFEMAGSSKDLTRTVTLKTRDDVSEVNLSAINVKSGKAISIGRMEKSGVSDGKAVWKRVWSTENIPAGHYRLSGVFKIKTTSTDSTFNLYDTQSYEIAGQTITAENSVDTESVAVDESTAPGATDATDAVDATTASAPIDPKIVGLRRDENTYYFEITAGIADTVRLNVVQDTVGKVTRLGLAEKKAVNKWGYRWDTSDSEAGEYTVYATVQNTDGSLDTNRLKLHIKEDAPLSAIITPADDSALEADTANELKGKIHLSLKGDSEAGTSKKLELEADPAVGSIELYAQNSQSIQAFFLGKAKKIRDTFWLYEWDTKTTPNGNYKVYAQSSLDNHLIVSNSFRFFVGSNDAVGTSSIKTFIRPEEVEKTKKIIAESYVESDKEVSFNERPNFAGVISDYRVDIDGVIEKLTSAIRTGDKQGIEVADKSAEELKKLILRNQVRDNTEENIAELDSILTDHLAIIKRKVSKTEEIIKTRVGDNVFKDTDRDGISDYDEEVIYHTDPASADTDGDGFNDGAEIMSGFDPLDPKSETPVAYESPKEQGIVRPDLFVVDKIEPLTVLPQESTNFEEQNSQLLMSGRGLPNSFVTLFVYSNPVVVTVRTDSDGLWNYQFEKELEDGEHEIYVGVTDNQGQLIAKSEPLRFVKTAEAFSTLSVEAANNIQSEAVTTDSSFLAKKLVLLVMSISIIIVGLVLLLLGMQLRGRKEHLIADVSV